MSTAKDWYARRLGGQASAPRPSAAPVPQPPMPPYTLPQAPTGYPQQPPPEVPTNARTPFEAAFIQGDRAGGHATQRLQQKLATDRCPECGSNDFLQHGNTAPRCFDCGYLSGRISHEFH